MVLKNFSGKVIRDIKNSEPTPEDEKVRKDINNRYDALGKMSYTEGVVLVHFVTLAILWFTRNPKFIAGILFHKNFNVRVE